MLQRFYAWLLPIKSIYFDDGWFTPAWKWYGGYAYLSDPSGLYRLEEVD